MKPEAKRGYGIKAKAELKRSQDLMKLPAHRSDRQTGPEGKRKGEEKVSRGIGIEGRKEEWNLCLCKRRCVEVT